MLVFEVSVLFPQMTNLLGQIRQCLQFFDNLNKDSESAMQGACNALGLDF